MAHFAILDESNIVTRVEVINNAVLLDGDGVEQEQLGIDFLTELYGVGNYKQTSYNKKNCVCCLTGYMLQKKIVNEKYLHNRSKWFYWKVSL